MRHCLRLWICLALAMGYAASAPAAAPAPESVPAPRPQFTAEQLREDLTYLRDVWAPQDKSFSPRQHEVFNSIVNDAIAGADQMDYRGFWLQVAHAVALSGNGHTSVGDPPFARLPFRAWWFPDGLYIVRAQPDQAQLLGARIERIGSFTPEQALARVAPFISGNGRRVRDISPGFLETPVILSRVGVTADPSATDLTLRLRDGTVRRVTLPVQASPDPAELHAEYWAVLIPGEPGLAGRWPHVLDAVASHSPAYDPVVDVSSAWLGAGRRVLYVRSNQILGTDGNDSAFAAKLYAILNDDVLREHPHALIVDLRLNGGGNFFNTILFAQALPKLLGPRARIFVLVRPSTFSAAIVTASLLKSAGGARVTLVGTPVGDESHFYAEGRPVVLPNTKIMVRPASGYQDWAQGCRDLTRCYWPNVVFGPGKISLEPGIRIDPPFADYASGHDAVLEAALAAGR